MEKRAGFALSALACLAIGTWACSSGGKTNGGGTGGEEETGGSSGETGGKTGSTGGKTGSTGGTTGSTGGSTGSTGGSTGSTGGSTGSTGGSTGSTGGSSGSTGGSNGSTGGSSGGDAGVDSGGGGGMGGPLTLKVDLPMKAPYMAPIFPKAASNTGSVATGNMSPMMSWSGLPPDTKSVAISMIDTGTLNSPSAMVKPGNGTKAHYVFWDIPATVTMLPANLPHTKTFMDPMGMKTTTFAGGTGYFGPGAGTTNIYVISVWALKVDTLAGAMAGASSASVYGMLMANSIAKASFVAVGTQGGL